MDMLATVGRSRDLKKKENQPIGVALEEETREESTK